MTRTKQHRPAVIRRSTVMGAAVALAMVVTACGSSGDSGGGDKASASASASSAGSDLVAQARARVEKATQSVTSGVPTSSPPAAKGKFVVLIPCASAAEGCSQPMDGAAEAAKALGWRVRTIDGKGTPADESTAIAQAISLKPDAIIMHAIDPSFVKGAVRDAKAAGIPVIVSSSPQSDLVAFSNTPTQDIWGRTGSLLADYMIAKTDGKAKWLALTNDEFGVVTLRTKGFLDAIAKCDTCAKQATASFTFADMASKLPQLTQQLLQKNPNVDAIYVPFDAAVPFVLQGLKAIGKKVMVVSSDGTSQALECIRKDCGQEVTTALPVTWIGWTDVDAANRIFNGEDPTPAATGLPIKIMTKDNVPSGSGPWQGDLDFPAAYRKLWKVGQ